MQQQQDDVNESSSDENRTEQWQPYTDQCSGGRCCNPSNQLFDNIMAADVIYNEMHAKSIPRVIDRYLNNQGGIFQCILPLRPQYRDVVELFERELLLAVGGLRLTSRKEFWYHHTASRQQNTVDTYGMCRDGVWYRWSTYVRL
jgi:hypothetical protein